MSAPVYLALDTTDLGRCLELITLTKDFITGAKVGLEFYANNGPQGVQYLFGEGEFPYFLDLKLHDIPNTVAKAVKALRERELIPNILTVHAGGGLDMMKAARDAAHPDTKVVGVTVLTSFDYDSYHTATGIGNPDEDSINPLRFVTNQMAMNAKEAGLDGIVCAGTDVMEIKLLWPDCFAVVPGLRPKGNDLGDQKRVMTPRAAMEAGADVLVVGRPITEAEDPAKVALAINWSLA